MGHEDNRNKLGEFLLEPEQEWCCGKEFRSEGDVARNWKKWEFAAQQSIRRRRQMLFGIGDPAIILVLAWRAARNLPPSIVRGVDADVHTARLPRASRRPNNFEHNLLSIREMHRQNKFDIPVHFIIRFQYREHSKLPEQNQA